MIIRQERKEEYRIVEEVIRKAFWNVNSPGCDAHYLAHILRGHADFISELDLVAEEDGKIVASVMYTKAKLMGENGQCKEILSFGPLGVLPEYQRKGYGRRLLAYSFEKAVSLGYDAIAIFGNPENYICNGFQCCKKFNVGVGGGVYPTALLVKELTCGAIPAGQWRFVESNAFEFDSQKAEEFDQSFEPLEKQYKKSQELFYIYCRSQVIG